MCLAIPGEVMEIYEENGLKMGKINYSGTINNVCLAQVDEVEVGQYVLVHAGFAISVLDEQDAKSSLDLWDELIDKASKDEQFRIEWKNKENKN